MHSPTSTAHGSDCEHPLCKANGQSADGSRTNGPDKGNDEHGRNAQLRMPNKVAFWSIGTTTPLHALDEEDLAGMVGEDEGIASSNGLLDEHKAPALAL